MLDVPATHAPLAALLRRQLDQVTLVFERQLASDLSSVNRLCLHVGQYRGKMLRPTLVFVSSLAGGGRPGGSAEERLVAAAAVVEMIHMATLVHDDVLDDAELRRGGATVSRTWGNETAVMLGDYLISNAFHLCSTIGDPALNLALGAVTNTVCEGEIMQIQHRGDWGIDESTYFEIVRRKTASLIGECCRLGAALGGSDADTALLLQRFGVDLGIAFQVRDDLLDLVGDQATLGKSLGRDLAKGELTLPLIMHLARTSQPERGAVLRLLERADHASLRRRLQESGAIDATQRWARRHADNAAAALDGLAPGPARDLLAHFARTAVSREC
jgi:octaprenyl-diphosphate synthase